MKKLTLSALIASSLLITACDQQAEAPEGVTEASTTLVEETIDVTTEDSVTEVVEEVLETTSDAVDSAPEDISEATSSEAAEMQEVNDMIAAEEIPVDEIMEKAAELAEEPEALDEEKVKEAAADLL